MSYRYEVLRTAGTDTSQPWGHRASLGALGLAGETGEVVEHIKKIIYHGKPLDRESLIKELGDVRWYLEYLAFCIDASMEEIEEANIAKLRKRFPLGFSHEAANEKADQK